MTAVAATIILAAIAVPHFLRLERASPPLAITVWMSALVLRALTALFTALFVLLYLPRSGIFQLVSHLCWHTVLPFLATHLGLSGHDLGDAALIAPSFVLAASVLSVLFGVWRAARRVRQLLVRHAIGEGPGESVILNDGDVVVAAAGLRRPRVVISAGALVAFDDEELAASLEHERGHISRRHRFVIVAAQLCRALGRFLPGTRVAMRELRFHLERDADGYAVRRRHEPAVLASAICKAAEANLLAAPALALGRGAVERRVEALLDERPPVGGQLRLRAVAAMMLALVAIAASALPAAAHAGYHQADATRPTHHCPS
jgi:Zn-dependent protease with chaperone function